jgi:hypothetical protein
MISFNFYASLLLIAILITTRKPTNKFTVVLWEVLLALLWQTSVWRRLRTQHLTNQVPPKKWFRYDDDVFSIIKKHALTNFYNLLNSIDPHINFTTEQELDGKLSFLDTLITRNNGSLSIDVYRKPTHTDRYLTRTMTNNTKLALH